MDYKAINNILNRYFDGTSTLEDEKKLKQYFDTDKVLPEHNAYKPLFDHFGNTHNVTNPKQVRLPYKQPKKNYKLAIAAVLVLGLGIFGLTRQNFVEKEIVSKNITQEKKKEAYKEMEKFSNSINKGIKRVSALSIFGKTTKKIFKIEEKK
jgi:hypothetical protein